MKDIFGLDELRGRIIDKGLCAACGACVGRCPYLTAFKGKTVVLDQCTLDQGRCFAYCPMTFFDPDAVSRFLFGEPHDSGGLGHVASVMASRSKDPTIAAAGQAGGSVTTLMAMALEAGWIDAAVLTAGPADNGYSKGIVASTVEEIRSCAGSRFTGAHSLAALREALDRGYSRIGVVGVPCQVKSLRKMALHALKNENLKDRIAFVIGLFCNWAFSSRDFVSFLSGRFEAKRIRKVHIPPPPANTVEIETENGLEKISLDELRPLIQTACQHCDDMTSEFSDLSVGMYEGRPGWNTLITRTELGRDLVELAIRERRLETDVFPEANLAHLKEASLNKKKRSAKDSD